MTCTKNGYQFNIAPTAWGSFWTSVENGEWESYTFTIMDRFLDKEKTCLDVGAWMGPFAMYASHLCKHVYAIEPDPVAYKGLCDNLAANSLPNVTTFQEAIMNYDGVVSLGNENDYGNTITRISQTAHQFPIQCRTFKTFVRDNNVADLGFIKVDVEGAEEVIFENTVFFEEQKPVLYISLHPFWFKDEAKGRETIRKVGRMYKKCYDAYLNEVNIEDNHGIYVFTN